MTYWDNGAPYNGTIWSVGPLIETGNGQCQSWQNFFKFCGSTHNIEIEDWTINYNGVINNESLVNEINGFKLGQSVFLIDENHSRFIGTKYWDISQKYIYLGMSSIHTNALNANLFNPDVGGLFGSEGQGNFNPRSLFLNHSINYYSNKFYDPSYGTNSFNTENEHENSSFDIAQGVLFGVGIDNQGIILNPPKIYLYIKKPNTLLKQLNYTKD